MGIARSTALDTDEIGVNELLYADVASVLISAGDVPRVIWTGSFAAFPSLAAGLAEDLFDARPQ